MMNIDQWQLAGWLCKVLLYISTAMCIGGLFCLKLLAKHAVLRRDNLRYVLIGGGLGVVITLLAFAVQVGNFADQGWAGMFNAHFARTILHSHSGSAQLMRLFGFVLILVLVALYRQCGLINRVLQFAVAGSAIVLLVASFAMQGHAINVGGIAPWLMFVHVLMVSLWMGALFPLWRASRTIAGQPLQQSMAQFGLLAGGIVSLLALCGGTVAVLLLKDLPTLLTTPYGQGFLFKMLLVGGILLLAASHKWWLVPRVTQAVYAKRLSQSILLEMLLGLLILLATGFITTIVGLD